MNPYFADTFYFLALLNSADEAHLRVRALGDQIATRGLVTTAWVLTEVGDALAAPTNRKLFAGLLQLLQSEPRSVILPADQALFEAGIDLYNHRADKSWPLTDCISFVVMQEQGMTEALTGDHHFEQAGFRAILK